MLEKSKYLYHLEPLEIAS